MGNRFSGTDGPPGPGHRSRAYSEASAGTYGGSGHQRNGRTGEDALPSSSNGITLTTSQISSRTHSLSAIGPGVVIPPRRPLTFQGLLDLSDSDSSTPDGSPNPRIRQLLQAHSFPGHLFTFQTDVKCPVCYKMLPSDDIECHLVMCLTKPRVKYNVDVLTEDKGECVICFEEMGEGETISRLPCLCIYHRHCIDKWFLINRSCPEHPSN